MDQRESPTSGRIDTPELVAPTPDRIQADLDTLAGMVDTSRSGHTRLAMSEADRLGRTWAAAQLRQLGLETQTDAAGNVIGRLAGSNPNRAALMTGSHLDTVDGGGRFDGMVGVVGALETVRTLQESDVRLDRDLLVVSFFNEEPNRFGLSCLGSRAMTGRLLPEHLSRLDDDGVSLGQAMVRTGLDVENLASAALASGNVRAFLELHIEQGPTLEEQGSQIGLVTSITGVARFRALFAGRRGHAGTTPMARRADAGCAAAGTVLAVEQLASVHDHARGTVGSVSFTPDAVNVITDRAEVVGELRSPVEEWLEEARHQLRQRAELEGGRRSVDVELEWLSDERPVAMADELLRLLDGTTRSLGYPRSQLYSGAEHDAAILAGLCPTGMVFVPSHDGLSHCPEEWTDLADITAGVHVLAQTLLAADRDLAD